MDRTILIRVADQYGRKVLYPANAQAELLARIAGTKTLTHVALALAEQMGFAIVTQVAPQDWKAA